MEASPAAGEVWPGGANRRTRWAQLGLGLLLVALVGAGYAIKLRPVTEPSGQDAFMKAGLDALGQGDAEAAARSFRQVLERNPRHYGATYQLAVALDRAGRPAEARPYWEKMKTMAEEAGDGPTLDTIRARLAKPEAPKPEAPSEEASQAALMEAGVDALYRKSDPATAAARFREVLRRNPRHYGAAYQLATALDQLAKPAEARPLWEQVARMAEEYKDQKTLDAARARLARKP